MIFPAFRRPLALILTIAAAGVLLPLITQTFPAAARAEERFSYLTTPGKLPKDVVPRAYAIRIAPDLQKLTCEGSETIQLEVLQPTRRLVLNAVNMEVPLASLAGVPGRGKPVELKPELDAKEETLAFALPVELPPGKYELALTFRYRLGNQAQGLYFERYGTPAGGKKTMLATQMEPADARRMFPCWDEPVFRATFQLTATLPKALDAVSNMPGTVTEVPPPVGDGPIVREHRFAPSPPMPSYLIAFLAGEFEEVTGEAEGVQLRILTTEGKRESARYALESTRRLLTYYNDYFGIKYPLPKLDQIAVPGGFGGAMENWGCITYNETALLFDPATSAAATRERVFAVIAHEMAHQWFGDLVTMAWWDNLWLNEGFASWMGTKATDQLNPDWQIQLRSHEAKDHAMTEDARRTTHPVQQPVKTERDAIEAFDAITYQKGQAIIRMTESWLGEAPFRDGIRRYMAEHKYSNTTTADLWAALGQASGKDVAAMAQGWTTQPGLPLVIAEMKAEPARTGGPAAIEVTQQRFTVGDGDFAPLRWEIPLSRGEFEPSGAPGKPFSQLLVAGQPLTFPPPTPSPERWPASLGTLNAGNIGYYRVQYPPEWFREILAGLGRFTAGDRLSLLGDAWALAEAGRQPITRYFELVNALRDETNTAVWEEIVRRLEAVDALETERPGRAAFRQYARTLLRPQLDRLGWDARPDEGATVPVLRDALITALGRFDDSAVVAEAFQRFDRFLKDPASLPANLRPAVFTLVGRHADAARFDQLLAFARGTVRSEEKQLAYRALAGASDAALARRALALALDPEEMSATVMARHLLPSAFKGEHPGIAWEFVKENLDRMLARLPSFEINRFFGRFVEPLSEVALADDLEKILAARPESAGSKAVAKTIEAIRFRAGLKARELPPLDAWVRQHGPADRAAVP